jgi:hypothetical protein
MGEVVGPFGGTEGVDQLADGVPERFVRAAAGRSSVLSLAKACSIGFRSGL